MGTVGKALGLLDILARSSNSRGLTSLASEAKFDKATTRRLLVELAARGFVEQDSVSRDYALGPALQMLGKAREEHFPLLRTVQPFVRALAAGTGETVHAAEYCAGVLVSICIEHSSKAIRVSIEHGHRLPLHATASGIAFLSASADTLVETIAGKPLERFTANTPVKPAALRRAVREAVARGYSISDQFLEDDVHSVAAAIRGANGKPIGTLAIADPTQRVTEKATERFGQLLRRAAEDVSRHLAGKKQTPPLRRAS